MICLKKQGIRQMEGMTSFEFFMVMILPPMVMVFGLFLIYRKFGVLPEDEKNHK